MEHFLTKDLYSFLNFAFINAQTLLKKTCDLAVPMMINKQKINTWCNIQIEGKKCLIWNDLYDVNKLQLLAHIPYSEANAKDLALIQMLPTYIHFK